MKTEKVYYFISNSDNHIHKTDEGNLKYSTPLNQTNRVKIQILGDGDEVLDEVIGYDSLGDLMESISDGGNDLE